VVDAANLSERAALMLPDDVRIVEVEGMFVLVSPERLQQLPDNLHVLLRNTPHLPAK